MGLTLSLTGLSAQNATQILDQTARTYAKMRSLRVESRMTVSMNSHGVMGEMNFTSRMTQLTMAMRPNMVRMEAQMQDQQLPMNTGRIRCDGKTLYVENGWLKQTMHKPAPRTLSEIYDAQTLSGAGYMLMGLDALYLLIHGDWRKMASSPKLLGRERVGNRQTYKIRVNLKPSSETPLPGGQMSQTLWIGVRDRLLWKSEVLMTTSQGGNRLTLRYTEVITRQEVNPPINPNAFAYKLPEGFKLVENFEVPDLAGEAGKLKGQPAGDFTLNDLQGNAVRLADHKGKVVVLNIFAHWCGPCRAEAPHLEKDIWQAYKDKGVVVLGVATWAHDNPTKRAQEFAKEFKLTFPVLVDADNKVAEQYKVDGVPTTFIIDKEGVVREVIVGADVERLKKAVESLLQAPANGAEG